MLMNLNLNEVLSR